ncbi:MAG: alpha/beta hydrolase [Hirschia sp.]|nr:alpha/beta hydrolase [Hirschia sp.]MBF19727.1 alpha/beta hydrolase [Hirschia sp.]
MPSTPDEPQFANERFISFDGAPLGLSVWEAKDVASPEVVIVGVHGMNDYAGAFRWSAPYWAEQGITTYAYDQRGFGRSPHNGIWPEEELMREDLRMAVDVARRRHPQARIAVVGISMGGAVAMTAFASDNPPDADLLVLSGPGLRGWGALPLLYRLSLWSSTHVRPGWVVVPPKRVARSITATDNEEVMEIQWHDPWFQKTNRIDAVFGVVTLMEHAHKAAAKLPAKVPTLFLYGDRDEIVPQRGVKRTAPMLPKHVQGAYYEGGYHMLLRDLNRQRVLDDVLAFLRAPGSELPSGASDLPWR